MEGRKGEKDEGREEGGSSQVVSRVLRYRCSSWGVGNIDSLAPPILPPPKASLCDIRHGSLPHPLTPSPPSLPHLPHRPHPLTPSLPQSLTPSRSSCTCNASKAMEAWMGAASAWRRIRSSSRDLCNMRRDSWGPRGVASAAAASRGRCSLCVVTGSEYMCMLNAASTASAAAI